MVFNTEAAGELGRSSDAASHRVFRVSRVLNWGAGTFWRSAVAFQGPAQASCGRSLPQPSRVQSVKNAETLNNQNLRFLLFLAHPGPMGPRSARYHVGRHHSVFGSKLGPRPHGPSVWMDGWFLTVRN